MLMTAHRNRWTLLSRAEEKLREVGLSMMPKSMPVNKDRGWDRTRLHVVSYFNIPMEVWAERGAMIHSRPDGNPSPVVAVASSGTTEEWIARFFSGIQTQSARVFLSYVPTLGHGEAQE